MLRPQPLALSSAEKTPHPIGRTHPLLLPAATRPPRRDGFTRLRGPLWLMATARHADRAAVAAEAVVGAEAEARCRQRIEVWSANVRIAMRGDSVGAHVVGEQEQDVGPVRCEEHSRVGQPKQDEAVANAFHGQGGLTGAASIHRALNCRACRFPPFWVHGFWGGASFVPDDVKLLVERSRHADIPTGELMETTLQAAGSKIKAPPAAAWS